jgi:hypothetical protein
LTSPCKIPFSDFLPILRQHINYLWSSYWNNLPANFASKYKSVIPNILKKTWFNNLKLSRLSIIQYSRLWVGHYLLPSHTYKLSLNGSPYCTKQPEEVICDLSHIIFSYPSLSCNRLVLFSFLKYQNIQLTLLYIFNSNLKSLYSEYYPSFLRLVCPFYQTQLL